MKTIQIKRAAGLSEPMTIVINESIDIVASRNPGDWQVRDAELYDKEAAAIVAALCAALPGGTLDRVIVKLLERRASLLNVGLFPVVSTDEAGHEVSFRGER